MAKPLPSDWFLRSRLKMRHVLLLAAIDEQRSLHKAAAALHMTQPAATKLLADLEALLELRLFERTARGLTPTAHGDSLVGLRGGGSGDAITVAVAAPRSSPE